MIRKPYVAGRFYPAGREELELAVKECLKGDFDKKDSIGIIVPHAGYIYSGKVAGKTFASVKIPDKVIILSPNHTGQGKRAAIMKDGEWETPLGKIKIETNLAEKLIKSSNLLEVDSLAHQYEHSLEVEIPFIQVLNKKTEFVPITVSHLNIKACEEIGNAIAKTIKDSKEKILIIASSDMSHFESQESTIRKDNMAIKEVLALNPKGLMEVCGNERITMCGVIPASVMLFAALSLGAKKGELVDHKTSGDVSGDYSGVVGYAGIIVK